MPPLMESEATTVLKGSRENRHSRLRPTVHMRVWLGKLPSSAQNLAINGKRIVAAPAAPQ